MPPDDILTDDYVAEMLAKEAADCSLKYSAMGLDAYNKPLKRPANQPKPNTRFLNNIIRDTTSHNRALLAREAADSKARLRELEREEEKKRQTERERLRRLRPGPSDTRKRMLGDIAAIIGGPSKKRKTDDGKRVDRPRVSEAKRPSRLDTSAGEEKSGPEDDQAQHRAHHPRHRNARKELFAYDDNTHAHSHRAHEARHRSRSRERDHKRHIDEPTSPSHSKGGSSGSHRSRTSQADSARKPLHRRGSTTDLFGGKKRRDPARELRLDRPHSSPPKDGESDSDPLEDIIGPSLPKSAATVRPRGRGTTKASSGIDSRFEVDYDPKTDVSVDEDDEWGTALERLRDRQKWKEQGADRLRAAGFNEDQIKKWEKGGQKSEEDVQWTKKGEEREWDRGKTLTKFRNGTVG